MITKILSVEELKQIWAEIFFLKQDKVTKIADHSVLNGVAYGCAKTAQKAIKDIAIIESHILPDSAYGIYLDNIADNLGISPRFGASESSTWLRLVADEGTLYKVDTHTFSSTTGIDFLLTEDVLISDLGFNYAKVRSSQQGAYSNVEPLTINTLNPIPSGHKYVINEYEATGGRDAESDDDFRKRIKEGTNILARGTVSMLEQVFMKINPNVLKLYKQGINDSGQIVLAILTQNGIDLSTSELDVLLQQGEQYFNLTELKPYGSQSYGILLKNIEFQAIDISFRVELFESYIPDDIRKEMQIKISKSFDYRTWDSNKMKIEWDDLLNICKNVKGVKYIPDQYFTPRTDVQIDKAKLPRIRSFTMWDLQGNILNNVINKLSPLYFPNQIDYNYQQTALSSITE